MRSPILLHLLRGSGALLMLMAMGGASLGWFVFIARGFVLPVEDPERLAAAHWGMGAFLGAGVLGAAAAARLHELRACPFAAQLPGLERRAVVELGAVEAALVGLALLLGAMLFPVAAGAGLTFFPVMVLLGFGVGAFNFDPRPGARMPWQVLPAVLAITPLLFAAEIAQLTAWWPLTALFAGAGLGGCLLMGTSTWAGRNRRWAERPRPALWPGVAWSPREGSIGDPRGSALSSMWRKTHRGNAAAFTGVRHTDWQWARAMLHESYGPVRGGWLANVALMTITLLVASAMAVVFHSSLAERGLAGISSLRDTLVFDPIFSPDDSSRLLFTGFLAWIFSIFILCWPMRTPLAHLYPISRARRGRAIWLITQAQEHAILLIGFSVLIAAGALFWMIAWWWAVDGVEGPRLLALTTWAGSLTAVVFIMPVARWARLQVIDGRSHPAFQSVLAHPGSMVAGIAIMAMLIPGAVGLQALWMFAGEKSLPLRWITGLLSVAAFLGLRWWWYAALQRFFARRDLA